MIFRVCKRSKEVCPTADDSGLLEKAPARTRREAEERIGKRLKRWLFNGGRPEPVPSRLEPVESPEHGKIGVCCSGGGIRSAAFSLGGLQALGAKGELQRASYLAAVSGGSYVASAISTVAKRAEPGDGGDRDSDPDLLERMHPFAPGSPEEQYLRNRSSYLAPTTMDKLYLGMRIVLGLLVNLIFISLPLIGAALIVTGLVYAPFLTDVAGNCTGGDECRFGLPRAFWAIPSLVLLLSVVLGLATLLFRWRSDEWERFFSTWAVRLLIAALTLAVLLVGLPYLVDWIGEVGGSGEKAEAVAGAGAAVSSAPSGSVNPSVFETIGGIGAGFLALTAGVLSQLARLLFSKDAAKTGGKVTEALGKLGSGLGLALAYVAGALVGPLLLVGVVAVTMAVGIAQASEGVEWALVLVGGGILVVFFTLLYRHADLTTWSLHPYYKRRLSSVFSLKRIKVDDLSEREKRRVEALEPRQSGSENGIAVERYYDELVPLSMTALSEESDGSRKWPTLLVCAAANVSDPGATPPGRTVTSFTFSAHTAGGPLVGAVRMRRLEQAFESSVEAQEMENSLGVTEEGLAAKAKAVWNSGARNRRRDLTLPAAVAMSGAAISPSMGKMTRKSLTFLMALANVRLGVWVPNPRWVAEGDETKSLSRRYVRPRPIYLVKELFGRNRIGDRYLYVTDGGHYENLGLVELLRRGCTEIYCLDATGVGRGGVEFEALGEAIALARSELGVEIEFDSEQPDEMVPSPGEKRPGADGKEIDQGPKPAKRDVVTGTITYRNGPGGKPLKGRLVYVRNTMTDKAPWDVRAHAKSDPRFPNNPTIDQLYTDQKFEAYRVLGERAGANAVAAMRD